MKTKDKRSFTIIGFLTLLLAAFSATATLVGVVNMGINWSTFPSHNEFIVNINSDADNKRKANSIGDVFAAVFNGGTAEAVIILNNTGSIVANVRCVFVGPSCVGGTLGTGKLALIPGSTFKPPKAF